jgi:hypothetical protein
MKSQKEQEHNLNFVLTSMQDWNAWLETSCGHFVPKTNLVLIAGLARDQSGRRDWNDK